MRFGSILGLALLVACGPSPDGATDDTDTDKGVDTAPDLTDVSIEFSAQFGPDPFMCGAQYPYVGTSLSEVEPTDMRAFIYDIELLDALANPTELILDDSSEWQSKRVVLLDFEDGTGPCEATGTAGTNRFITGSIPTAEYSGIKFKIGLPFNMNHKLPEEQEPPMNEPTMYVGEAVGHAMFSYNMTTLGEPDGYPVLIHSTGCSVEPFVGVTDCISENVLEVTLRNFDLATQTVVFDIKDLLANANVDKNTNGTPNGCQSVPTDEDCRIVMDTYGFGALGPTQFISAR